MVSARLLLLGSALCLSACAAARYPAIRPVISQADTQATPFERAYADGKAHLAAGHPGLAIVAFERALRIDAGSITALNGIGAAYDELKRFDIAMGYYQRALALAPRDAATMNNIAVSLRLSGNSAAADWLDKASRIAPSNAVIAANIAQARADAASAAATHEAPAEPAGEIAQAPAPDQTPKIARTGVDTFELGLPPGGNPPVQPVAPSAASAVVQSAESRVESPVALVQPPAVSSVVAVTELRPIAPVTQIAELRPASFIVPAAATIDETTAAMSAGHSSAPPKTGADLPTTEKVDVSNCVGRTGMAKRFRALLRSEGLPVRHITNSPPFDCLKTRLLAHTGHDSQVQAIARLVPQPIEIETDDTMTDDIRLVLGRDLLDFDRTLGD
jgi:hypothetical protein